MQYENYFQKIRELFVGKMKKKGLYYHEQYSIDWAH
jgi:hypothetical protein